MNGSETVTLYGYDEDGNDKEDLGIMETDADYAYSIYLAEMSIKSIVTKEQFESVEYKIKEEK